MTHFVANGTAMITTLTTQPAVLPSADNANNGLHLGQNKLQPSTGDTAGQLKQAKTVTDSVTLSNESLALNKQEAVDDLKAVSKDSAVNSYAKTILSAITSHIDKLAADGADPESLKQAIYDGLNGFQQGYNEALGELDTAGVLSDELKAELSVTEQQVMQGLADYAKVNGLEIEIEELDQASVLQSASEPEAVAITNPEPQATMVSTTPSKPSYSVNEVRAYQQQSIIESFSRHNSPSEMQGRQSAFVESYKEQQSASMEIVTQDGDVVKLNFEALKAMQVSGGYRDNEAGLTQILQASKQGGSDFAFSVQGELDEGELDALISLMEDVNALASEFFEGDFDRAFQMATEIQMDKSELSSMSLDLKRSVTYEAVQSYSSIANNGSSDTSNQGFKTNYLANGLQHVLEKAGQFANAEDLIKDLFANQWAQQSLAGLNNDAENSVYNKAAPLQAYA